MIIVDIKNKDYGENKIQNKDIYQLSFYGMYFYDNSNLLIIYPNYRNNSFNKESKLKLNTYQTKDSSLCIRVKGIDINMFLDLLKDEIKNKEKITDSLINIVKKNI